MEILAVDGRQLPDFKDLSDFLSVMKMVRPLRIKFAAYANVLVRPGNRESTGPMFTDLPDGKLLGSAAQELVGGDKYAKNGTLLLGSAAQELVAGDK
jgi:hypothetical protein